MGYIRFVRPNRIENQRHREGVFCAAYELRDCPSVDGRTLAHLEEILQWFRENLPIAGRFNRSSSKGAYRRETQGLSWYKDVATEAIGKSFELVRLLAENGYPIEVLRCDRVGYVLYEDDHQVVAEPFGDTPT
ncbi:hypothetical protein [Frigidibacter sp. SD6-1]|uniref:hypothetical protein n=1 Tax=Frigidibacter sp. SD6-1 TaxID=3032581 RepID=UPI0024E0324A|nr:hypothetical protein [Frigidibacter sp. SD6-1]